MGESRPEVLSRVMEIERPDADCTTFGVVLLALTLLGFAASLTAWKDPIAKDIRVIYLGLLIFFVFIHAMQLWHPYQHRFFILAVPWMAIAVAWFIAGISTAAKRLFWTLALLSSSLTAVNLQLNTYNAGFQASFKPKDSIFSLVQISWTEWINEKTNDHEPIYVALPPDRALTPFYRREGQGLVRQLKISELDDSTVEDIVDELDGAWLITEAHRFRGKEGQLEHHELLFNDDPLSGFSLAAYRKPRVNRGQTSSKE
jgi:hypothetical protein